jgi:hypothetical protein
MGTLTSQTVTTIRHVAHTWLLLAPIAAMGTLTSANHYYCWTRVVAASAHINNGHFDITDHCYCRTCGTCMVAAGAHSNDGTDISGLLVLLDMWHMQGCF